jgi:hypothetical protein
LALHCTCVAYGFEIRDDKDTTMKSILKTNVALPSAIIFFTLAGATVAAVDKQVPFRGAVQGHETDEPQGGIPPQQIRVDGTLTGVATHLGRFTMTYQVTVNLNPQAGPIGSATGFAQLIAANGDTILTRVVGQGVPVEGQPGVHRIVEINTITGGTGRFAGVSGSFILERLVDLGSQPATTAGSFQGTISSPDGAH